MYWYLLYYLCYVDTWCVVLKNKFHTISHTFENTLNPHGNNMPDYILHTFDNWKNIPSHIHFFSLPNHGIPLRSFFLYFSRFYFAFCSNIITTTSPPSLPRHVNFIPSGSCGTKKSDLLKMTLNLLARRLSHLRNTYCKEININLYQVVSYSSSVCIWLWWRECISNGIEIITPSLSIPRCCYSSGSGEWREWSRWDKFHFVAVPGHHQQQPNLIKYYTTTNEDKKPVSSNTTHRNQIQPGGVVVVSIELSDQERNFLYTETEGSRGNLLIWLRTIREFEVLWAIM
jgi:hypothetical protein